MPGPASPTGTAMARPTSSSAPAPERSSGTGTEVPASCRSWMGRRPWCRRPKRRSRGLPGGAPRSRPPTGTKTDEWTSWWETCRSGARPGKASTARCGSSCGKTQARSLLRARQTCGSPEPGGWGRPPARASVFQVGSRKSEVGGRTLEGRTGKARRRFRSGNSFRLAFAGNNCKNNTGWWSTHRAGIAPLSIDNADRQEGASLSYFNFRVERAQVGALEERDLPEGDGGDAAERDLPLDGIVAVVVRLRLAHLVEGKGLQIGEPPPVEEFHPPAPIGRLERATGWKEES